MHFQLMFELTWCNIYSVCDRTFFPSLLSEMSEIVGCFNQRAHKLLELHLASGFTKQTHKIN